MIFRITTQKVVYLFAELMVVVEVVVEVAAEVAVEVLDWVIAGWGVEAEEEEEKMTVRLKNIATQRSQSRSLIDPEKHLAIKDVLRKKTSFL